MFDSPENLTQLGAIAIICIFLIKEVFVYLKTRNGDGALNQINQKLDNHIVSINKEMVEIKEDIREVKKDILEIKIKIK